MANAFKEKEIDGLDYFVILGEDSNGQTPSTTYCTDYAESTGVDSSKMLIDGSWETLFSYIDSGQAGGLGLPWDAVLNGDGMEYYWNATKGSPNTPEQAIDELLE